MSRTGHESFSPRVDISFRVGISLAEANRRLIMATVRSCGGDKRKAAALLCISVKTLYNRLREYGELDALSAVAADSPAVRSRVPDPFAGEAVPVPGTSRRADSGRV